MEDERPYYQMYDYGDWEDCSADQYDIDNGKSREHVEAIYQLLQSGQPFSSEIKDVERPRQDFVAPIKCEDKKPPVPTTPIPSAPATPVTPVTPTLPQAPLPVASSPSSKTNKSLKHKCVTCSQVFDSPMALSIHVGRIHKSEGRDKSHQCPHCPKTFHNASYLSQHKRIHTGVKPYKCDMCPKRFTQLSHLQQHKRTHSGEKPYKCTQPGCTKAFSQLSNLQSHTRSHLPNVPKCTSCYKCFFDEKSLNAHLRTHTMNKRVRNYTCEECGQRFTQDTYLQNHINKKHRTGAMEKQTFPPKQPSAQPTSIQAATSMICKMEEPGAASCTATPNLTSPLMHRMQSLPHPLMTNPLTGEQKNSAYSKDYRPEASYQRPAVATPQFPTSHECDSQHSSSAFKPPPVRAVQQSMEVNQQRPIPVSTQPQQNPVSTGYEQMNSSILGLMSTQQDIKPPIDRQQQETDMMWRIRNNMAASIGSYSSFNSQIQQYMASGGGYAPSSFSAYMNSPLDSSYVDKIGSYVDKLASGHFHSEMFEDDSANEDYLMLGGFRESCN